MTKLSTIEQDNLQKITLKNCWVEFLRYISIILILLTNFSSANHFLFDGWKTSCFGVMLFVFISGFSSINSTKWKTNKFFITTLVWVINGFVIYGIFHLFNVVKVKNPISIFFCTFYATSYSSWWFLFVYLALTLFQPFLNMFITKFDKWIVFGIIFVLFLCLILKISFNTNNESITTYFFMSFDKLFYFILIYSFGGWVSFHYKDKISCKKHILKSLLFFMLIIDFVILAHYHNNIFKILMNNDVEYQHHQLTIIYELLILSCCIFSVAFFLSLPTINSKYFNLFLLKLGDISLAVYLIHDVCWISLDYFFLKFFMDNLFLNTLKMLIYLLIATMIGYLMNEWINLNI